MTFEEQMMLIAICSIVTIMTRALPFLIFRNGKKIPDTVEYIGKVLPVAIFAMLVVYCLKDVEFTDGTFGIPEVLAIAVMCAVHIRKKNMLLSILTGMIAYFLFLWLIPIVL
ncbi:MAG: AzlD domain-containing protein [archaeon]|nr:AzlD domain-containing protein [archaeon]